MGGKPHDSVGPTLPVAILTYFSFGVLILFGRMRYVWLLFVVSSPGAWMRLSGGFPLWLQ